MVNLTDLVWVEFECTNVHVSLPKWPTNQFKPVQKSRQQGLIAHCPNINTVYSGRIHSDVYTRWSNGDRDVIEGKVFRKNFRFDFNLKLLYVWGFDLNFFFSTMTQIVWESGT